VQSRAQEAAIAREFLRTILPAQEEALPPAKAAEASEPIGLLAVLKYLSDQRAR